MSATVAADFPVFDQDIFDREALRHPFEHYRAIRDTGPVVQLGDSGLLAMGRFADVQQALRSPEVLISGKGVGLNDQVNNRPPGILASDGESHRRMRTNFIRPLMPAALKTHRDDFKSVIEKRVRECTNTGWFDGVAMLAQFLPLTVISHLVGLPEEARRQMLQWAAAGFDLQQPFKPELAAKARIFMEALEFIRTVERSELRPGSWSELLFQEADKGRISEDDVRASIGALTLPSLDTTIHSKSGMLYFIGSNPDQWELLKSEPSLVSSAVLESVRLSSVVRWFTRLAAADYRHGDVFVPQGERVVLMYGSANRDERRYMDPDRFDARRNPTDQLGWGTGPHMCAGMHLAKLEMEVLLEALIENVDGIEVDDPVPSSNGGLYGFESLRMRLTRR
jgi:cytochrome P450